MAKISEFNNFKGFSEDKDDSISSEPATLLKLAEVADADSAPHIAEKLSNTDDKAAAGAFFSMAERFLLGADASECIHQPDGRFVYRLLKHAKENSAISSRGFMRENEKLKAEYIAKYGEPSSNKERVLMENEVCAPRVSFYYGIHPSMDLIVDATMPVVVNTEIYDDIWENGYITPQITRNMMKLKQGIDAIPDKPPQKLKELLKDAIESNWVFCMSECGVEASAMMLGALAKHYGKEADVQQYFAKLYAECVSAQAIIRNSNAEYTHLYYHGSSQGWTVRAYKEMAAGIRDIVQKFMPEMLKGVAPKEQTQQIRKENKEKMVVHRRIS